MKRNRKTEGFQTTLAERNAYGAYYIGQNMIYMLVTGYMITYLMMEGLEQIKIAAVVFAVKIWDAVNDALFGVVFDKVKFKSGRKCTPWLKLSTPLIAAATCLIFWSPDTLSANGKLLWFAVAYFLWDSAYTFCDAPIYTMLNTVTDNLQERNALFTRGRLSSAVGSLAATGAVTILVSEKVGMSFGAVAALLAVLALAAMLPAGFRCRERNYHPDENAEENFTVRQMFRYLLQNKYLLIFYSGYVIQNSLATGTGIVLFVCYYLFHDSTFNIYLGLATLVPGLLCAVLTPSMLKRVEKRRLYLGSMAALTAMSFLVFLGGCHNKALFLTLAVLRAIPGGMVAMLNFMFTPDCAEYGKFASGIDAKGITFAIQTFSGKLAGAIATSSALAVLALFRWNTIEASSFEEIARLGITQPESAIGGLWVVYALIPAVGALLSLVPYSFYRLRDKDVQIMAKCNAGEITREEAQAALSQKY